MIQWEDGNPGYFAKSGELTVGHVGQRPNGDWYWLITAVHTKFISKHGGESTSLEGAKRNLVHSWKRWLDHAGLRP